MSNKYKDRSANAEKNAPVAQGQPGPAPGPDGPAPKASPIKFVLIIFALAALLIGLAKLLRG